MTDARQLQDLVVAFVRTFGLHHPEQTPCGQPVTVSEAHALMELVQEGPLQQKGLAVGLQLDKSTVSRLVVKLMHRGWLESERDPEDGRALHLRLTDAGRQMAGQLSEARGVKFSQVIAALGTEEQETVVRGLTALLRALDKTRGV